MDKTHHWDNVYTTKLATEVSWYETEPTESLKLILDAVGKTRGRIIDIGGGQSFLVDHAIGAGFAQVAVLDISSAAIEATKKRLGDKASLVRWVIADITRTESLGQFDVWHDRAMLHFLTDEQDRQHYVDLLRSTLPSGGYFVVGTFASGGPEKCSGLPIQQYDEASMRRFLGCDFQAVRSFERIHTTPAGKPQRFFLGVYQRTEGAS